jgi:hypothetical protein
MANAATNDINEDLFAKLQQPDTDVQNSAPDDIDPLDAAVRKCIHPPSSIPNFTGLPTNDVRSQIIAQYVDVGINTTPIIFDRGTGQTRQVTAADLGTFDYAFLMMNGNKNNFVSFIYNVTSNVLEQDFANISQNDAYNWDNFAADATVSRLAARSATFCLNATAFNDTGMVTGAQFNPNIMFAGTLYAMLDTMPMHFYSFVKSEHRRISSYPNYRRCDRRHPDYTTHSKNFSQFPTYVQAEIRRHLEMPEDEYPTLDPNTTIQVVNLGRTGSSGVVNSIVPTPSQLMNMTTRSYTGKAREGAFVVSRQNTVSPAWCSAGLATSGGVLGPGQLYQCYTFTGDISTGSHFVPIAGPCGAGLSIIPTLLDTLWSKDQTWSWVYFQGLSMNPNVGTSLQLIMRKVYSTIEIQPSPISPWAGLTRPAPMPNVRTMQAIMDAFYSQKDCLPARYNFWGTLLAALPGLFSAGESVVKLLTKSEDTGKTDNRTQKKSNTARRTPKVRTKRNPPRTDSARPTQDDDMSRRLRDLTKRLDDLDMPSATRAPKRNSESPRSRLPRRNRKPRQTTTRSRRAITY